MNFTKTYLLITSLLFVSQGPVFAQEDDFEETGLTDNGASFQFVAGSVANFRQSPTEVKFDGGIYNLLIRDGRLDFIPGCASFFYFPPGTPGCTPGATGFLTAGDIDGDGLEDPGTYFSVTNIAPATFLKPFQAEDVLLISAPPSALPRPLAGLTNRSKSLFFNIQTQFVRQYDITNYAFNRQYTSAERGRFDKELVPGSYIYSFPAVASPIIPVNLAINQFAKLEGFRKKNNQKVGFRFIDVTYDDGFAVLNPFVINTFKWEGNSPTFITPGADFLYLSIKQLQDPTDPASDPDRQSPPVFPNFTGPAVTRVLLPSPLNTSYIFAPNFLIPGATGLLDLEFYINRSTNSVTTENSIRRFRLPVKVSNPFVVPPPPNVASSVFSDANADFDKDGVSNFDEWVFGSDRNNPLSIPFMPKLAFASSTSTPISPLAQLSEIPTSGAWEFKVAKKKNPVPKLKYEIQRSTNMVNWTTVTATDPNWILTDDNIKSEIKATSRTPEPVGGGFFRVRVTAQ